MTLQPGDKEYIKDKLTDQEKYIISVISGDRKTHAIHFQNIDRELTSITNKQEIILLNLERLGALIQQDKCQTCENNKDLKKYKEKMYPYELLMQYKRVPFYTASVLFLAMIWDKLPYVWEIVKSKILGL